MTCICIKLLDTVIMKFLIHLIINDSSLIESNLILQILKSDF